MTDRGPSRPDPKGLGSPLPSAMIPDSVECPFCMDTDTEQFGAFGSALSVSQYWCMWPRRGWGPPLPRAVRASPVQVGMPLELTMGVSAACSATSSGL